MSHEPKSNHPGFSRSYCPDGMMQPEKTSRSEYCLPVCFLYIFLRSPLWIWMAEIPVCNASASSHELRTLMEGKRGCRRFYPRTAPVAVQCLVEQKKCESFVTRISWDITCFVRFLWQIAERWWILGLLLLLLSIKKLSLFATLVKKAFCVNILFWYLMDSCVIHSLSDHFIVLHPFELCIFTGIVLPFFFVIVVAKWSLGCVLRKLCQRMCFYFVSVE